MSIQKNPNIKYILVLNGGGIRGVMTASFLNELEKWLGQPLCNFFDLFAGTSIGGILALGLSSAHLNANELVEILNEKNAKKIMNKSIFDRILPIQDRPKYDGKNKTKLIQKYLGDDTCYLYDEHVLPTVIPTFDIVKGTSKVFHNLVSKTKDKMNVTVSSLADATSAAPTYFPTVDVTNADKTRTYYLVDGGLSLNNPTMSTITLASKIWSDHFENLQVKVLNIGTGRFKKNQDDNQIGKESKGWGAIGFLENGLISNLMNQDYVVNQATCLLGKSSYLYIDINLTDIASSSMDDTSSCNIHNLQKAGQSLFVDNKEQLENFFN